MKRAAFITIILVAALTVAGTAQAEFLFYNPAYYSAQAESGKTVSVPFMVTINGLSGPAGVNFVDSVKMGNLPASWISATPGNASVDPNRPLARTNLSISVPANAAPGTYSAFVFSYVSNLEGGADPGRGAFIAITVVAPEAACAESPNIEVSSVSPEVVKTPNNRPVDVTITGSISTPEGCNRAALSYQVTDEYGSANSTGSFSAGTNGDFNMTVPLLATRTGQDKDGRTFGITLTANNEAGASARTVNVNVLHDRR